MGNESLFTDTEKTRTPFPSCLYSVTFYRLVKHFRIVSMLNAGVKTSHRVEDNIENWRQNRFFFFFKFPYYF